jgi:hypothetical protein
MTEKKEGCSHLRSRNLLHTRAKRKGPQAAAPQKQDDKKTPTFNIGVLCSEREDGSSFGQPAVVLAVCSDAGVDRKLECRASNPHLAASAKVPITGSIAQPFTGSLHYRQWP